MWRRFHNVWYQGIWGAIACIAVVCAAAGRDVFAMPNLREQCFANEAPAALEACRSYVAESRFTSSDLMRLGGELEKQSLFKNAVVVYEQGLRYRPESNELRQRLRMAESLRNEAARESTTPDPGDRAKRLAQIACTQLAGARALEACQRATALDPDNATLYERLGDVLTGLGRAAEASQAYQNARRLGRVNAGSTGSVQATARPEPVVPSKPQPEPVVPSKPRPEPVVPRASAEAVPSGSAAVAAPSGEAPPASYTRESNALSVQLQMLDKLRKDGLISGEEYKERKAKLLDTVFTPQPLSIPAQPARMDDDRTVLADVKLGNFYALVIGNDDYKNIPKLKSAIVDAKAVGTLLEKEYGFRVTSTLQCQSLSDFKRTLGLSPQALRTRQLVDLLRRSRCTRRRYPARLLVAH